MGKTKAASGLLQMLVLSSALALGISDTPANCTYEDIRGKWVFATGPNQNDRSLQCSHFTGPVTSQTQVTLQFPDVAVDQFGNIGFWTMIYNQGFEVVVAGRKYFAFSKFEKNGNNTTSSCNEIMPGWSHDSLGHNWACYLGKKVGTTATEKKSQSTEPSPRKSNALKFKSDYFHNDKDFIARINAVQRSWTAVEYPHLEDLHREKILAMAGGRASRVAGRPKPAPTTRDVLKSAAKLPKNFDWRNVEGVNFVSPIRKQGGCGSCYAFASMAMNEARIRILTNNTRQPVFSPQDIVDCSEYSQGCDGGFPYLIGGKYAEDFGLVLESENPYVGKDQGVCKTPSSAARYYATQYQYVGGFYGACNEELMQLAVYENGPVVVGFEVLKDFMHYKGGIYSHTGLGGGFQPFELTNHAVLVVGYGVEESTGEKYWITKNSWGPEWGEKGFFRILRGVDECSFESMAVQSKPLVSL